MNDKNGGLTEESKKFLKKLINKNLLKVYYHYWGYRANLKYSLDWIELFFDKKTKVCFCAGNLAENLNIVAFDWEKKEVIKMFEHCNERERVSITSYNVSNNKLWEEIINKKLLNIEINGDTRLAIDYSVILTFPNKKIEIFAIVDNVDAKEI